MKRTLIFLGLAGGAFILWQWWLSRQNPKIAIAEERRRQADGIGKKAEILQLVNRPGILSPELADKTAGVISQLEGLWSTISGGRVNNNPKKPLQPPLPKDPLIYGLNN